MVQHKFTKLSLFLFSTTLFKNNTNREDNHQQANWTSVSQGWLAVCCFLLWMRLGPATRPPCWMVQRGDPYGQVQQSCLPWGPCVGSSKTPLHHRLINPRCWELLVPRFYQGSFVFAVSYILNNSPGSFLLCSHNVPLLKFTGFFSVKNIPDVRKLKNIKWLKPQPSFLYT